MNNNNNNNKTYKGISSKKTVILGAHVVSPSVMELLPMEDMPLLDKRDQAIVIEEDVIKDIIPSSEAPFGEEWEVYDVRVLWSYQHLQSATLMPFLQGTEQPNFMLAYREKRTTTSKRRAALMPQ